MQTETAEAATATAVKPTMLHRMMMAQRRRQEKLASAQQQHQRQPVVNWPKRIHVMNRLWDFASRRLCTWSTLHIAVNLIDRAVAVWAAEAGGGGFSDPHRMAEATMSSAADNVDLLATAALWCACKFNEECQFVDWFSPEVDEVLSIRHCLWLWQHIADYCGGAALDEHARYCITRRLRHHCASTGDQTMMQLIRNREQVPHPMMLQQLIAIAMQPLEDEIQQPPTQQKQPPLPQQTKSKLTLLSMDVDINSMLASTSYLPDALEQQQTPPPPQQQQQQQQPKTNVELLLQQQWPITHVNLLRMEAALLQSVGFCMVEAGECCVVDWIHAMADAAGIDAASDVRVQVWMRTLAAATLCPLWNRYSSYQWSLSLMSAATAAGVNQQNHQHQHRHPCESILNDLLRMQSHEPHSFTLQQGKAAGDLCVDKTPEQVVSQYSASAIVYFLAALLPMGDVK